MKRRLLAFIGARPQAGGHREPGRLPQRVARGDGRHRTSTTINTADPVEIARILAALRDWVPEKDKDK